jgi:hypothetical protein
MSKTREKRENRKKKCTQLISPPVRLLTYCQHFEIM